LASVYASTRQRCGRRGRVLRRAAQRAGVGVVGASATSWGRGVQARILGGLAKDEQLMADDQHTSMAFVAPHVASKYDLLPHPPAFQPHFHSCQTALPLALHTLQNPSIWTTIFLLTIANASQLANRIVSQHTTTHRALSTLPGLILLMSAGLPFFVLVHSLVVIWDVHASSNIFFSVEAHFCCLVTRVFVCADVSVGVGAFVCVQNTTSGPDSEPHPTTAKTAARKPRPHGW